MPLFEVMRLHTKRLDATGAEDGRSLRSTRLKFRLPIEVCRIAPVVYFCSYRQFQRLSVPGVNRAKPHRKLPCTEARRVLGRSFAPEHPLFTFDGYKNTWTTCKAAGFRCLEQRVTFNGGTQKKCDPYSTRILVTRTPMGGP